MQYFARMTLTGGFHPRAACSEAEHLLRQETNFVEGSIDLQCAFSKRSHTPILSASQTLASRRQAPLKINRFTSIGLGKTKPNNETFLYMLNISEDYEAHLSEFR